MATTIAAVVSAALVVIGWNWDISWHRSIGRDSIWSLPHLAIIGSLIVATIFNSWLILSHSFGARRELPSIRVFGFRGPSGAFLTIWAALWQGTALIFDDWWHNTYGLDVGVYSPSHYALAFGMASVAGGQLLFTGKVYNTSSGKKKLIARYSVIAVMGYAIGVQFLGLDPSFGHMGMRAISFMITAALFFPFLLIFVTEFLESAWAAAGSALVYMGTILVLMRIFVLFPTTPEFAPVYQQLPHFAPPPFPCLVIVPALLVGLLHARWKAKRGLLYFVVQAVVFLIAWVATNHGLSALLVSPWGDNAIFYGAFPESAFQDAPRQLRLVESTQEALLLAPLLLVIATISGYCGAKSGRWFRGLSR